jgi:hypothetical protein
MERIGAEIGCLQDRPQKIEIPAQACRFERREIRDPVAAPSPDRGFAKMLEQVPQFGNCPLFLLGSSVMSEKSRTSAYHREYGLVSTAASTIGGASFRW